MNDHGQTSDDEGSAAPSAPPSGETSTTPTPTTADVAAPAVKLLHRERGSGLGMGRALAFGILLATTVPSLALLREAARDDNATTVTAVPTGATSTSTPVSATEKTVLQAALDDVTAQLDANAVATAALQARAVDAERGDRLRLLGRAVAKARDVRRAAGLAGAELRSPFPANELGKLDELGFGPRRWLIARDASAVIVPAGTTVPAALATNGRDEDPLTVDGIGDVPAAVRRCLPNEGYCIVDLEDDAAAVHRVSLDAVRAALSAATTSAQTVASRPTKPSTTTTTTTKRSKALLFALALSGIALGTFAARKLWNLSTLLRRRGWRLRAGAARDDDDGGLAELRELDDAIDDAIARFADGAAAVGLQRRRRERLQTIADALDDARDRGGVPRIETDVDDDTALAAVAFSTNALLDVLDARATRAKLALDDVNGAMKVLTPLAQRLLRLARVPDLPSQAADELTSLGTALGQRVRRVGTLPALVDEAARLAPASSDVMSRAEALKPLPGDDALRLGISAQHDTDGSDQAESSSTPPRPST